MAIEVFNNKASMGSPSENLYGWASSPYNCLVQVHLFIEKLEEPRKGKRIFGSIRFMEEPLPRYEGDFEVIRPFDVNLYTQMIVPIYMDFAVSRHQYLKYKLLGVNLQSKPKEGVTFDEEHYKDGWYFDASVIMNMEKIREFQENK